MLVFLLCAIFFFTPEIKTGMECHTCFIVKFRSMCVDSVLFELMLFNLGPCAKKPIICLLLIWHVLGSLKTVISACVRACFCVCQNEGECMRERTRERERERERGNLRAVDSCILVVFYSFHFYFTLCTVYVFWFRYNIDVISSKA